MKSCLVTRPFEPAIEPFLVNPMGAPHDTVGRSSHTQPVPEPKYARKTEWALFAWQTSGDPTNGGEKMVQGETEKPKPATGPHGPATLLFCSVSPCPTQFYCHELLWGARSVCAQSDLPVLPPDCVVLGCGLINIIYFKLAETKEGT